MSTQPLPVHLLDGPAAGLQALGRFPLAHYLRPLHLNVLPLLLGQAVSMARETAPRSAPSPGSGLSVPCRTRFWSAPERSKWMTSPLFGVVHKRAFVTLGHKSLPPACSGVGHKGIVQYAPIGGRMSRVKHSCRSGINYSCRFTSCSLPRCWVAAAGGVARPQGDQGVRGRLQGVPPGRHLPGAAGSHPQLRNGH